MIKLKFDARREVIEVFRDKHIITTLNSSDFGSLIQEVKRIIEEASPKLARKKQRKEERRHLINNLKILVAVNFMRLIRKIKGFFSTSK